MRAYSARSYLGGLTLRPGIKEQAIVPHARYWKQGFCMMESIILGSLTGHWLVWCSTPGDSTSQAVRNAVARTAA